MRTPAGLIDCPLHEAALKDPSRPAIHWGSRRITFAQLNQYVNAAVRSFKERGIRAGHRVALISENSVELVIVLLALWRMGAVASPLNPKFPPLSIRTLLISLKLQAVIITKSLTLSGPKPSYAVIDITDLIVYEVKDTFVPAQAPQVTLSSNQEAVIVFTSGSSGAPKAAVLTYGNLYFNALGSNACVTIDNKSSWLLSLPLYHVSGLGILFRCLIAGAAIVVAPREETARLLQEGKATHVSMVATQLFRLLHDYAFNWPKNMQAILLGGSAMPQNILRMALEQKLPVYISYGLTEMASQVATGRLNNIEGGCARVLPHRELKIDPDGEICVRGQTLFKGYLEGDSLRLPFDQDSWFHTGDVGRLDVNGCLVVTGRKDNMFICGGENIHPEEIEAALLRIDSIMQAFVVTKEDKEFGQRPVAFIRWEKDILSDDALRTILMGQLPKFKIPCAFYPWPSQADGGGVKVSRRYFVELIKGDS